MTGRRVVALLLLTLVARGSGGVPMMPKARRAYWQLKQYIWEKELDDRGVARVVAGLKHEHPDVVCCAVTVIVAHRRLDLLPAVKKTAAARKDVAGDIARTAIVVLGRKPRRLAVPLVDKDRGASHSLKIALLEAAVLLEARERRMGLQPALKEASLDLERHQRTLLEYSKMKEAEAIRVLVSRIQSLKVIKGTYANVLPTYGDAGAAAALECLEAGKGLTKLGTIALMDALRPLAFLVDAKTRARIDRVLAKLAGSDEERVADVARGVRRYIATAEGEGSLTPAVDADALYGDFIAALKKRMWSDADGFDKCVLRPQTIVYGKDPMTTSRLKEPARWRAFRDGLPALRKDTYDSFWAENQQVKPVAPKGEIPMQVHVLTEAECAELDAVRKGHWDFFRSRYGKAVEVRLGAPGVSRDGKQALLYCVAWWDKKAGRGSLFLLVHEGGHWEIAGEDTIWWS